MVQVAEWILPPPIRERERVTLRHEGVIRAGRVLAKVLFVIIALAVAWQLGEITAERIAKVEVN